jgi:hypothetical protein
LERGKLVTVAVLWKAPPGWGTPHAKKKAGRAVYWRIKGHASRRTLKRESLQQQMADNRRQVRM